MRYASIRNLDVSNGEEIGIALFVQGCHFHCENCFNKETWDFQQGKEWNNEIENKFIDLANPNYIKRITILGGEPLADENILTVFELLKKIKSKFNNSKKIWLYTGYTFEELIDNNKTFILPYIDILIEGRFVNSLRDVTLKWRGSSNQNVIDVNKTIQNKKRIIYCN